MISIIVAVAANGVIGDKNKLLWHISEDLKHFKALTNGHTVILGRRTLSTFPGGRPLKGRRNLVLSRNPRFAPEGAEVFRDLPSLLAAAPGDAFVIGGASVYAALLDKCDTAYVTKISGRFPAADCFFPDLDALSEWRVEEEGPELEEEGVKFRYVTYKRA